MSQLGITALINFSDWDDPKYPETGGVNSVIKNILPYLKADRIVLYGITYEKKNLLKMKVVNDKLSVFPVIYKFDSNPIPNRLLGLMLGWRLKKYLKVHGIDFVYSHSEELAFWIDSTGIPYIHHLHTFVNALEVSNGKLARIKVLQQLWEKMRHRVIKRSFKSIAVNKDIVSMLTKIIGANRIIRFPNYVDSKKFAYSDPSAIEKQYYLENKKVALFIGRITKIKGLEHFVESVGALNKIDNQSWVGLIVGNGEYQQTIKEYINQRNLNSEFVFPGSINTPSELSKFYSLANVFLITSLSESVPLTLLESLSCGTPVVSTRVGIAEDVLGFGNGFVLLTNNANETAQLVLKSLSFKSKKSLLINPYEYSVEHASNLLNDEFERKRN